MGNQDEGSVLYRANAIALAGASPAPTVVDNHWTLDNGATGHVAGNKDWITSWKGMSHLVQPDKSTLRGRRGTAKIDLFMAISTTS